VVALGDRAASTPRVPSLNKPSRLVLVLLLLGALPACATKRDVRDLQALVSELHAQNQSLLRELQENQIRQDGSLAVLAETLQESRAESARRLTNIEDQLLTVQELAGLSQQQVASLRDQYERDRQEDRSAAGGGFGSGGFQPGAGGSSGAAELFDAAVTQFNRGSYAAARVGFEEVVAAHGSDPLAPEARYYLAQILNNEGDVEGAIDAFLEIPEFHPTAERVPDAYYWAGRLHLGLGDTDQARQYFERVVNTWPDSMVADMARDELGRL
jgi:TolA-binding protein